MRSGHWRRSLRLTGVLLGVWLAVTVLPVWFARELAASFASGWTLVAIVVAQGAPLAYLVITSIHVWSANRMDEAVGDEPEVPLR